MLYIFIEWRVSKWQWHFHTRGPRTRDTNYTGSQIDYTVRSRDQRPVLCLRDCHNDNICALTTMQTILQQSAAKLLASRCQRSFYSTGSLPHQQSTSPSVASWTSKALLWGAAFVGTAVTLGQTVHLDAQEDSKDLDTRSLYDISDNAKLL